MEEELSAQEHNTSIHGIHKSFWITSASLEYNNHHLILNKGDGVKDKGGKTARPMIWNTKKKSNNHSGPPSFP
jgi:hypothetical protein